jgi:hypothetical protein
MIFRVLLLILASPLIVIFGALISIVLGAAVAFGVFVLILWAVVAMAIDD